MNRAEKFEKDIRKIHLSEQAISNRKTSFPE
jgi:hypothetical protein